MQDKLIKQLNLRRTSPSKDQYHHLTGTNKGMKTEELYLLGFLQPRMSQHLSGEITLYQVHKTKQNKTKQSKPCTMNDEGFREENLEVPFPFPTKSLQTWKDIDRKWTRL